MVDWQSQSELAHDAAAFSSFIHALLGLYIWEWFTTLDFDITFLTRRRKFKWPLTFYFLDRYSILAALVGIAISLNVTTPIDCQSLYTFNQLAGNFAIGFSSINLSLRTIAVWSNSLKVVVPICVIIIGHWFLLLRSIVIVKVAWTGSGCTITSTDNRWLSAIYIYTMCFDLVVTALMAWKLLRPAVGVRGHANRLTELVFGDGLIYFFIAFLSNTIAVIFIFLNLNAVMSVIAEVPAAVASAIVACRVVRRLANFSYGTAGAEMFTSDVPSTTLKFESARGHVDTSSVRLPHGGRNGVLVQIHTGTLRSVGDDIELNVNSEGTSDSTHTRVDKHNATELHKPYPGQGGIAYNIDVESVMQYDVEGRILDHEAGHEVPYDAGAERIRREFKGYQS